MQIVFEHSWLLWLLVLLPIAVGIYLYAVSTKNKIAKNLGDAHLVKALTATYSPKKYLLKFLMIAVALGGLLLAVANPQVFKKGSSNAKNGIDIVFALDVSKSMLAQDLKPNRLERAKQLMAKLIDKLENDRIAIVIFAGRAYLQMPLTADHEAAKMYIAAASPQAVPTQGTAIAEALRVSNACFNPTDKKYKTIVLLTDGENHEASADEVAETVAKNDGVVVNTVAFGSAEGSQIIDEQTGQPKIDKAGNIVITKVDEASLQNLAQLGNGVFASFSNTDEVSGQITSFLSTLDKRNIADKTSGDFNSLFLWLLIPVFLFLLIEVFVNETKRKMSSKAAAILLFGFLLSQNLQAQNGLKAIKDGNIAYKKSEFEQAKSQYGLALQQNSTDATAWFNLGNASFKAKQTDSALNAFDAAALNAKTATAKSNALYNKGVALQNNKKLPECIKAYKEALIQNPANADARHNLQLALKQQQQQNQQQKKDNKKQEKPKEKPDEKPEQQKSNISKKEAEQQLQALLQKEKQLQDKMHKQNNSSPNNPEKDW
jgi:tetratricopeptide (TPR) repeat protein